MTTKRPSTPAAASTAVSVTKAKGRPMLSWVGKRPLREVRAFPSQLVERFAPETPAGVAGEGVDWSDWPERFDRGGLLFHGDNKEVLAHLLATGFRGKVDLVYELDAPGRRSTGGGPHHGHAGRGGPRGGATHGSMIPMHTCSEIHHDHEDHDHAPGRPDVGHR